MKWSCTKTALPTKRFRSIRSDNFSTATECESHTHTNTHTHQAEKSHILWELPEMMSAESKIDDKAIINGNSSLCAQKQKPIHRHDKTCTKDKTIKMTT